MYTLKFKTILMTQYTLLKTINIELFESMDSQLLSL